MADKPPREDILLERIERAREALVRLRSNCAQQKRFLESLEATYTEHFGDKIETKPHKTVPER
jgi:hypothetical protein